MKNPIKAAWQRYRQKRVERSAHWNSMETCFHDMQTYNKEHPVPHADTASDTSVSDGGGGSDGGSD